MADFLWISLIASVVLTVGINLLFWMFPGMGRSLSNWTHRQSQEQDDQKHSNVRIIFPWKTMIVLSVGLTILLNLGFLFGRLDGA